ncbi:MAG: serine/threonine protein kinase [Planctomycetota bacterium]|nr:MAG: serine/threonine protein kinase [Planctomycetota bacterium]
MPTRQPEPIAAPPATDQDSEATLIEPTPVSKTTQTSDTNRPDDSVTLIEPIAVKSPPASATRSAVTGRSATAPIANQETLVEPPSDPAKPPAPTRTPGKRFDIPQRLGDYELLEELGRGGMGIVYRARQVSVNRVVALKVIRPDRLASMTQATKRKIVERFRNEAEAAARINHDNLVTVYEVGCEADCHYFSMRYVEGSSLSEKTRKSPADNRQAAEWIEPICRAVDAVHRNGILHRDLKPQNILWETATGRTLLADFGLAKLADDDANMTQTGDAVGTPSYMSPEQFEDASSVGVGTDIYGLGATLYCLLSGRPPFQASSAMLTMKQVISTDAVPLRQVNPAVDRDLETICMKCLDKSPARRYDSAASLADELKRYLEGRPILARPVSLPERTARWCRRNPLVASLIGATFAAVVFGVGALGVSNVRTEAARKRSEESFQEAMAAVNDLFTRVSEERLLNEPGLQEVRRDLLDRARSYYERFLRRRENDPTLQAELAETKFRMGLIEEALGDPQAAFGWFANARDAQKARVAAHPDSLADARALSNTLTAMGRVAAQREKLDDATENFTEAQTLRERLLEKTSKAEDKFDLLRLHANSRMNLGLVERRRGTLYVEAQDQRRKTLPTKPTDRAMRRDLAKGFYNLANLALDRNDEAALRENIDEAIKLYEQLLTENPRDLDDQYLLSLCYRLRADLFAALVPRDPQFGPAAIDDYSNASRIVQRLSDLNPSVTKYLRELVRLSINLGQLSAQQTKNEDAVAHFRRALELLEQLLKQSPDTLDPQDAALRQTIEAALVQLQAPKS